MNKKAAGANYSPPGHKSTIGGKGASAPDKPGVDFGLSARMDIGERAGEPKVSSDGSHAGFASERLVPRSTESVRSKGKTFNLEG